MVHLAGILLVTLVTLLCTVSNVSSQVANSTDCIVVLSELSPPVYPRLANQAAIAGDVKLTVHVRSDGTTESVEFVSGHAMLKPAAMDSAQQSKFECRRCGDSRVSYPLTYTFKIVPRNPPRDCGASAEVSQLPIEVDSADHKVTVSAWQMWICDPGDQIRRVKVRSPKCLYMWKCGLRSTN